MSLSGGGCHEKADWIYIYLDSSGHDFYDVSTQSVLGDCVCSVVAVSRMPAV